MQEVPLPTFTTRKVLFVAIFVQHGNSTFIRTFVIFTSLLSEYNNGKWVMVMKVIIIREKCIHIYQYLEDRGTQKKTKKKNVRYPYVNRTSSLVDRYTSEINTLTANVPIV